MRDEASAILPPDEPEPTAPSRRFPVQQAVINWLFEIQPVGTHWHGAADTARWAMRWMGHQTPEGWYPSDYVLHAVTVHFRNICARHNIPVTP